MPAATGAATVLALGLVVPAAVAVHERVAAGVLAPVIASWVTVFIAVVVQALPFLVLGTAVSAAIAALVPSRVVDALIPGRPSRAVPVAGLAGALLPGCECASVPVAARMMGRGIAPPAALTFLLAAPAINPVVLVATAVAFPGQPRMVLARFAASLLASVLVGWFWVNLDATRWLRLPQSVLDRHGDRTGFADAMQHDFLHAAGFLVIGAGLTATLNVALPRSLVDSVAARPAVAVAAMALLAVVVAVCSEADAFVAASFTTVSPTAQLAFMVVGPMIDVKLAAMQLGTFGRSFTSRFAPLTFVAALGAATCIGWALL